MQSVQDRLIAAQQPFEFGPVAQRLIGAQREQTFTEGFDRGLLSSAGSLLKSATLPRRIVTTALEALGADPDTTSVVDALFRSMNSGNELAAQAGQAAQDVAETIPQGTQTFASNVGNAAGSALALAPTSIVGGPMLTGAVSAAQEASDLMEEAKAKGASPQRQLLAALAGAPIGATEAWGAEQALGKLGKVFMGAPRELRTGIVSAIVGELVKSGAGEAGEELAQGLGEQAVRQWVIQDPQAQKDLSGWLQEFGDIWLNQGLPAGVVGMLMGGMAESAQFLVGDHERPAASGNSGPRGATGAPAPSVSQQIDEATGKVIPAGAPQVAPLNEQLAAGNSEIPVNAEAAGVPVENRPAEQSAPSPEPVQAVQSVQNAQTAQEAPGSTQAPQVSEIAPGAPSTAQETPEVEPIEALKSRYKPNNPFAEKAARARLKYERLIQPSARDEAMAQSFPLGPGYGRPGGKRRVEQTIDRAVAAQAALREAEYREAQAQAFDAGRINAQGRATSPEAHARAEKRQRDQRSRNERFDAATIAREGKEPWQVTSAIYTDSAKVFGGNPLKFLQAEHRQAVADAIAQGNAVPVDVLAEYPDLIPPEPQSAAQAATETPVRAEAAGIASTDPTPEEIDRAREFAQSQGGKVSVARLQREFNIGLERASKIAAALSNAAPAIAPVAVPTTSESVETRQNTSTPQATVGTATSVDEPTAAREPSQPPPDATGVKNRTVDAELEKMGLPPAEHGQSRSDAEVYGLAKQRFDADPHVGARVVDDLENSQRPATDDETALLTFEVNRLINEREDAEKAYNADPTPENRARIEAATAAYARAAEVVTKSGTQSARAFRLRQMMLARDYSLAAIERAVQVANEGAALTDEQRSEIGELHAKLQATQKELERVQSEAAIKQASLEAENAILRLKRKATRTEKIAASRAKIDELFTELNTLARRAHAGLDPEIVKVVGRLAAEHIRIGYLKFEAWAEQMVARAGENIRPYLESAWNAAVEEHRKELGTKIKARLQAGEKINDLGRYVNKIAEEFVASGINDREELIDAVHGVLKSIDKNITREQARDAISGYGDFKPLNNDEVKVRLRDLRGQMQQLGKLDDVAKGLAPQKTGPERRTPSDEERRLIKRVHEEMRARGIKTTSPETQLKTTIDSIATRLRNQISDLQHAIDTGERIVKGERQPLTSPEIEALKAKRDEVKAQYDATFNAPQEVQGPEMPDDVRRERARARAVENALRKSLAKYEQELQTGEKAQREQSAPISTPEIDALRARRDAIRSELQDIRDAQREAIRQQREATRAKAREQAKTARELDREEERAAREAARLSPEQRAIKTRMTRLNNEYARLQELRFYGLIEDVTDYRRKRAKPELPPEVLDAMARNEQAKRDINALLERDRLKYRTKTQVVIEGAKEVLDTYRAVITGFDFSAVGRQGILLILDPKRWKAAATQYLPDMFRSAGSERAFQRIDQRIRNRELFNVGEQAGLELTSLDGKPTRLEEAIKSKWSDRIPWLRGSNRAYVSFLNSLRAGAFDDMYRSLPTTPTPEQAKELARLVNIFTGRGQAGRNEAFVRHVGTVLWAPKLYLSRLQVLSEPIRQGYRAAAGRGDAATAKAYASQYARTLTGAVAIYTLASIAAEAFRRDDDPPVLNWDPNSSDFGKVRIGSTRIDPMGGLMQYTTLISRTVTGRGAEGHKIEKWDNATRFARYKLAPQWSLAWNIIEGKTAVGEQFDAKELAWSLAPMSLRDLTEAVEAHGVPMGTAIGIAGIFGLGVNTYEKR